MSLSQPFFHPTVLVVGGSGGIGRAICLEFGRDGWRVGIHYRGNRAGAEHTASELSSFGAEGFPIQADIRERDQVEAMVQVVVERWKGLDVCICSAGQAPSQLLARTDPKEWEATIETNLTGTFLCLRAVAAHMVARGKGSIIVLGSLSGGEGRAGQAAYAASKAGLLGLVRTAAREWGTSNVTVNAVLPGWHRTPLSGAAMPRDEALDDHVLRRTPNLDAVARSIHHLALQKDVSGQIWNLDSRFLY